MTGKRKEERQLLIERLKKAVEADSSLTIAELKARFGALGVTTIREHVGEKRMREAAPHGSNVKNRRLKRVIARLKASS